MRFNRLPFLSAFSAACLASVATAIAISAARPDPAAWRRGFQRMAPRRQISRFPDLNRSRRWSPMPSYRAAADHSIRLGVRAGPLR